MRFLKRFSCLLFSLCLIASAGMPVTAAEKDAYTYRIRFLAGAQGDFDPNGNLTNNGTQSPRMEDGGCLVFEGLKVGDRVNFSSRMISLRDNSKYYVKGIRESGKDNNTVYFSAFTVEGDKDYVVAYGILGDAVAYTINYEDEAGRSLAPSETYYGNVGDRPVVSYLYIEGYQPQAYNLIGRLSENAADNVFTFVYSRVSAGTTTTTTTTTPGTTTTTTVDEGTVTEGGDAAAGAGGVAGGAVGGAAGAGADEGAAGPAGPTGDDAAGTPDETPGEPEDIRDINDEEVPLANGDAVGDSGAKGPTDFAKLMAVPLSAKVGICSLLVLIAGASVRFVVLRKRRKQENG